MIYFLIIFLSLIFLVILHEFSHFLVAKKFGVKVEEFGIGYPPRLFGKKFGETIYSLNLLPFGAFVRLAGEIEKSDDRRSFSQQPVSKRIFISLAGVFSFWIISVIISAFLFFVGNPVAISDEENSNLISPKVQIVGIANNSPAEKVGLKVGDIIKKIKTENCLSENEDCQALVTKVKEIQQLTKTNLGQELILTIERGKEIFDVKIVPRISYPEGEGPIGIILSRITIKKYPFHLALWEAIKNTFFLTVSVIEGYFLAIKNLIFGLPSGVKVMGPVGIFQLAYQITQVGFVYFFNFLALLAIYLAILNALPIPAFDGGKVLFLTIEGIRKKPISQKVEEKVTAFFFTLLIILAIFVTIKDILRIFGL